MFARNGRNFSSPASSPVNVNVAASAGLFAVLWYLYGCPPCGLMDEHCSVWEFFEMAKLPTSDLGLLITSSQFENFYHWLVQKSSNIAHDSYHSQNKNWMNEIVDQLSKCRGPCRTASVSHNEIGLTCTSSPAIIGPSATITLCISWISGQNVRYAGWPSGRGEEGSGIWRDGNIIRINPPYNNLLSNTSKIQIRSDELEMAKLRFRILSAPPININKSNND